VDLNTITDIVRAPEDPPGPRWRDGDAWLAGGTWLFSDQQPNLRRLVDLAALGWDELTADESGLHIGAMCTIADLYAFVAPDDWSAAALLRVSCEAFLASFKVWNAATVGGNICMSLPAGPMITLAVALRAQCVILGSDGTQRLVDAADFVTGDHRNILSPADVLRAVHIPGDALRARHAHRRFTLTKLGRSTLFMIGTQRRAGDELLLTITAGTVRPVRLAFDAMPQPAELHRRIEELPETIWFDDANGTPAHRRHLALHYAQEIRTELTAGGRIR
jgi:CO/xanthine dehydrogenase FAD-binding subunit